MQEMGVKVLRTWVATLLTASAFHTHLASYNMQGFNAINGSELTGALESGLTYYQVRSVLLNLQT